MRACVRVCVCVRASVRVHVSECVCVCVWFVPSVCFCWVLAAAALEDSTCAASVSGLRYLYKTI